MTTNTETVPTNQRRNTRTVDYHHDANLVSEGLRRMRRQAGLTQAAVAARLRRPTSFVGKYENGYHRLDVLEFLNPSLTAVLLRCFRISGLRRQEYSSGTTNARKPGPGRSDGRLADASRLRVDAEHVVDGPLFGFGLRGGAHVQGASVGAPEGGGDALLAFEDAA